MSFSTGHSHFIPNYFHRIFWTITVITWLFPWTKTYAYPTVHEFVFPNWMLIIIGALIFKYETQQVMWKDMVIDEWIFAFARKQTATTRLWIWNELRLYSEILYLFLILGLFKRIRFRFENCLISDDLSGPCFSEFLLLLFLGREERENFIRSDGHFFRWSLRKFQKKFERKSESQFSVV